MPDIDEQKMDIDEQKMDEGASGDSLSLLEQLPIELIQEPLAQDLSSEDLQSPSQASKAMFFSCEPLLEDDAEKLLSHVLKGKETEALAMIEANPHLLLIPSKATDYSGLSYQGFTPFQAALSTHDVVLWKKIEPYFDKLPDGETEKVRQFRQLFPEGLPQQESYDFTELVQVISNSSDDDIRAALGKRKHDTPIFQALNRFRTAFTDLARKEIFFNPWHLTAAVQAYNLLKTHPRTSRNQLDLFFRQVIGYTQRFLPACYAQVLCQGPDYNLKEKKPNLRSLEHSQGLYFPLFYSSGLGFDFAFIFPPSMWEHPYWSATTGSHYLHADVEWPAALVYYFKQIKQNYLDFSTTHLFKLLGEIDIPNKDEKKMDEGTSEDLSPERLPTKKLIQEPLAQDLSNEDLQNPLLEEQAKDLLTLIVRGDEANALAMIEKNPRLLFTHSEATDYSGRSYQGFTPFQAALSTHDVALWKKIEPYFDKLLNGEAEKVKQFRQLLPVRTPLLGGLPQQLPYDFTELVQVISNSSDADIRAALSKEKNDTPICQALNKFRTAFTDLARKEMICNPSHLIAALRTYTFERWTENQRDLFWRQVIGYTQRFLPACYAQAFCQGLDSKIDMPKLRSLECERHGLYFPLSDSSGLGFDFGAPMSSRGAPLNSVINYVNQIQQDYLDLDLDLRLARRRMDNPPAAVAHSRQALFFSSSEGGDAGRRGEKRKDMDDGSSKGSVAKTSKTH